MQIHIKKLKWQSWVYVAENLHEQIAFLNLLSGLNREGYDPYFFGI